MRRYSHDGAGTISHEYIIRDINRNFLAVNRIDSISSDEHTSLLVAGRCSFNIAHTACLLLISLDFSFFRTACHEFIDVRMLRRHYHVCRTEECICSCCENFKNLIGILDLKVYVSAVALSDPVALHGLDLIRPSFKLVQIIKQPVSVISDLQIPLRQILLCDFSFASFTLTIYYLLVGKYSLAARAPVDRIVLLICKTLLIELDEEPLCPSVILRCACGDPAVPVI